MWWRLKEAGVLGINKRNSSLIMKYNQRSRYPLVDDKLKTKMLALRNDVPVPELYGLIEYQYQVSRIEQLIETKDSFVLKPSRGSGGEGIMVVSSKVKKGYRLTSGALITFDELSDHVASILGGVYSLGGHQDKALLEYKVNFDPIFADVSYQGVPDIRVIVYFGIPILAMLRLPTRMSAGKANLHQGAVGAGLDIATGITTHAVWQNEPITEHPETGNVIKGIQVPHWNTILNLASRSFLLTGLGYQGVDIVLDKEKGPLLLELNARPGIGIQLANNIGLETRVKEAESRLSTLSTVEDKVNFALNHF